jgi:hypothetical protein
LGSGLTVVVKNDSGDTLTLTSNGAFTFATAVENGSGYAVAVRTQPAGQICTVANGSGNIDGADITNIAVTCANAHSVGGMISGLSSGETVVLQNNGGDDLTLTDNGAFVFSSVLGDGTSYAVTVGRQPAPHRNCAVANGSGAIDGADVTNIAVTCATTYAVGGTLEGLGAGETVVLQNNGGDDLTLADNGAFAFATELKVDTDYSVTVKTSPEGKNVFLGRQYGTSSGPDVTNVEVVVTRPGQIVYGSLAGMGTWQEGRSIILLNNGSNALTLTHDGEFSFPASVWAGDRYDITVGTQPKGKLCSVANGSGIVGDAEIYLEVTCVNVYTLGGTITGLSSGLSVTLKNGADTLTLEGTGESTFPFTFPAAVLGGSYNVTVDTQPDGQLCSVSNGSGEIGTNVTSVEVHCVHVYTVGGVITGLSSGLSVTLNNGTDTLLLGSGGFTFPIALHQGDSYHIIVTDVPAGWTCSVGHGSGIIGVGNVTNVTVTCSTLTFTVGGSISGLSGTVTLLNNHVDPLVLSTDGFFTFSAPLANGAEYDVMVGMHPAGQHCSVANASGQITSNVTNVAVTCKDAHSVGGSISGLLNGLSVTLRNGADALTLEGTGELTVPFTFPTPLEDGAQYEVTVGVQPAHQNCTVSAAEGTINGQNVTNVVVTCVTNTYTVGGSISGLLSGLSVTLKNGADTLTLEGTGESTFMFTFPTPLPYLATYEVTVDQQPDGPACQVLNGTGTVNGNVGSVQVTCVNVYPVGGSVRFLREGTAIVLRNTPNGDSVGVTGDGSELVPFVFPTRLPLNAPYALAVSQQPQGQFCSVYKGNSGTITGDSSATSLLVVCNPAFSLGGMLSGLGANLHVVLLSNGSDSLTLTGNGPFTFSTLVQAHYQVTVGEQPAGQTCTVVDGEGEVQGADVTSIDVFCSSTTYSLGGELQGLGDERSVTLKNSDGSSLELTADGAFSFPTPLAEGATYEVTVGSQPSGQFCMVDQGSGVMTNDVTTVAVTCAKAYIVGVTIGGLGGRKSVALQNDYTILQNNFSEGRTFINGTFHFDAPLPAGASYHVWVKTQPAYQTCYVANGSGSIVDHDVNVDVTCL